MYKFIYVWTCVFISFEYIPGSEIARSWLSYARSVFSFWGTAKLFLTVAAPLYVFTSIVNFLLVYILVQFSCSVMSNSVTPWTIAHQTPPSMAFYRQEYWSGLPFHSPGDLLGPGIEPWSPALQADTSPSEPPGLPYQMYDSHVFSWSLLNCLLIHLIVSTVEFDEVQFIFSMKFFISGVISKKPWPTASPLLTSGFSYKSVMVVAFIFRSLIHFVLTFIWCEVRVQLHSVLCGYQITPTCFVEEICLSLNCLQIRSNQSLSRVRLFATPWIAAHQASLAITNSRGSLRLTSIESAMPFRHLILCHPLFFLPPIPPSIRVFASL